MGDSVSYTVKLTLYAAGPIRKRTKHKEPRLLMGEASRRVERSVSPAIAGIGSDRGAAREGVRSVMCGQGFRHNQSNTGGATHTPSREEFFCGSSHGPQHFLNFRPLPQGQGSLRPTFPNA